MTDYMANIPELQRKYGGTITGDELCKMWVHNGHRFNRVGWCDELKTTIERYLDMLENPPKPKRERKQRQEPTPPAHRLPAITGGVPMPDEWTFRPSDLSNTEIFAALARGRLFYIPELKLWHYYNGKRWAPDPQRIEVEKIVVEAIQSIYALSADAASETERKMYGAWALKSEDGGRRREMVAGAERHADLVKSLSEFDRDTLLFNCDNGTLDLRTGKLLPHNPNDYLTKISPVQYDAAAPCPLWEATVNAALRGSVETIDFLQKFFGYCLTGDTREQAAVFEYGKSGANGKTTITTAVYDILGDYACKIGIASLLAGVRRSPGGPSEDVARLAGIRLAIASEPPEGGRFDDALLKDLTGGDAMNARHLHARSFDFMPQLKLCIFGNHKPALRGSDGAVRRRLRLIEFNHKFTNPDRKMPDKLRGEYPGILSWLVRGCMKWQAEGLGEPATIKAATDEYFADNNVLQQFMDQGYLRDSSEGAQVLFSDFYSAFLDFTGTSRLSKPKFSIMIRDELGLEVEAGTGNKKYVKGIREISITDPEGGEEIDEAPYL